MVCQVLPPPQLLYFRGCSTPALVCAVARYCAEVFINIVSMLSSLFHVGAFAVVVDSTPADNDSNKMFKIIVRAHVCANVQCVYVCL